MRMFAMGLIPLVVLIGCASRDPIIKGEPSRELSTPYTLKSGGFAPPLQQGLSIEHAELWFNFDFKRKVLFGSATLTLDAQRPKRTLSVDLDTRFKIEQVWINSEPVPAGNVKNPDGQLLITPRQAVSFPLTLKIDYYGQPRTAPNPPWSGGVVWSQTPQGSPWVVSAVQGEGCDLIWPCIDQPFGEPKTADINITVPKHLVGVSNGNLADITELEAANTFHWRVTSPINTYGIAFNIGPYDKLEEGYKSIFGNRFPMVYYFLRDDKPQQARTLFEELPQMLTFFEQVIGPYPFGDEKVGIVQTPHKGMEHQTINAYGNGYAKDEYGFDWLMQHELAHEWFGNQMTNTNWDHMWLHEGLGTYMQPLYAQYLHGNLAYLAYMNKIRKSIANDAPLVSGMIRSENEVARAKEGPGLDLYYKGAWVMHTLRYLMGDADFFNGIRELVYGTVSPRPGTFSPLQRNTRDFIKIMNKHHGKSLDWFFDIYLFEADLPRLNIARSDSSLTLSWTVPQTKAFPMPVEVSINGEVQTLNLSRPQNIRVKPDDIVIVDPQSKLLRQEKRYETFRANKESS
ncbi:M1 family metallopeptidase [Salinimonas chungwhensis]|uniref:M1 family metallopeptidase n=1 Tax=Salinimonas chungwhensis TaxID=265425 RepID=UPI00038112D2|nr:M1 family metallopeptidase [Salinimonas chungwhensis]